jgi:3-oxoacyl-[acyl-carrier protein] reductase
MVGLHGASMPTSRLALVTGAGSPSGIGFAVAKTLGRAGHRVVIAGLSARVLTRVDELTAMGLSASGFVGDLSDEAVVADLHRQHGPVEVLVNNAGMAASGVIDEQCPVSAMSASLWRSVLERNLTSAFLVTRACIPSMVERGYGRIVNIASTTGAVAGVAGDAAYAAAKAGLLGFTRSLALEVATAGVTVNAIAPGWIATGSQTQAEQAAGRATPVGRSGTPDEVAAAIAFLAGESASYITGQMLIVDGGNAIVESRA